MVHNRFNHVYKHIDLPNKINVVVEWPLEALIQSRVKATIAIYRLRTTCNRPRLDELVGITLSLTLLYIVNRVEWLSDN